MPDSNISATIRAALIDSASGVVRDPALIRADLFRLASSEARFHEFLESEATPDTVTAGFLREQLDQR